jgi:hypothetical protein
MKTGKGLEISSIKSLGKSAKTVIETKQAQSPSPQQPFFCFCVSDDCFLQHAVLQLLSELDCAFLQQAFWHFETVWCTSFLDLLLSHAHAESCVAVVKTSNKTILSDMESFFFIILECKDDYKFCAIHPIMGF